MVVRDKVNVISDRSEFRGVEEFTFEGEWVDRVW